MTSIDLNPMIDAVRDAVTLTRRALDAGASASTKGDDSPVTVADYGAQAVLCRAIATHYPGEGVVGEESAGGFEALLDADARARVTRLVSEAVGEAVTVEQVAAWLDHGAGQHRDATTWVIDPIDGTVGYVNRRYYAVCAARMTAHQPREAVMGLPRSPLDASGTVIYTDGETLTAAALDGSHTRAVGASSRKAGEARPLDSYKIPESDRQLNAAIRARAGLRAAEPGLYDSQIKYALVAAGYAEVFVRLPRDITQEPHYIWDHATGTALLQAAGAHHTDLTGAPLDYSSGETLPHTGFIASSGAFHTQIVNAAEEILF